MQDGDSAIQRVGYLDTNYIWYASTGSIIVPLAADFTTANIHDNQMYSTVTCSLPVTITRETYYMSADPGYDDHKLYDLQQRYGISVGVSSTEI